MDNKIENTSNYNAWIPAPVLYSPDLPDKAKLLFCVISGLVAAGIIVGIPASSTYSPIARDEASPAEPLMATGCISVSALIAVSVPATVD